MLINFQKEIFNPVYIPLIHDKSRYKLLYGGAGSGKSFFTAQRFLAHLLAEERNRIVLIRKVAKTIKESSYRQIRELIRCYNLEDFFHCVDSALRIVSKINKHNELFCLGVDDREKLKSLTNVNKVWVEEATELDERDFLQLDLRIRGKSEGIKEIYLTFNPIHAEHWLNKIKLKNCVRLRTTYKHNKYIDKEYIARLQELKEQNIDYYNIYVLGIWGVLHEVVYHPFIPCNSMPKSIDETFYGLDFGFNVPTALVRVCVRDAIFYVEELIYETHLTNSQLINKLKMLDIDKSDYIYCDSAEPDRIEEIHGAGFNAHPSDKSIKDGIDYIKSIHSSIRSYKGNTNLNKEILSYCYKKDKNGKVLDEVVKDKDHALDALRYALYTHKKNTKKEKFKMSFIK